MRDQVSRGFERVMLIKHIYYRSYYNQIGLTTGLGYISEALIRSGIANTVVDMELGYKWKELKERIKEFRPDLIGFSMISFGFKNTYRFIDEVKETFPEIVIVVGGPHLSTLREKVMEECRSIDYGITLEGEQTIVDLCRGEIPPSEIKGLLFRKDSRRIVYTGDREFIGDLDANGFPKYSQFELERYPYHITIITSRGCPYTCIYCPVNSAIGKKFRFRSATSVADEFEYWYEGGYRRFEIADDNFTLHIDRVWEICDELDKRGLFGLRISCGNGVRADKVNKSLLKRMKEVGFFYLAFGVESSNNKILEHLGKGERIETIEQAIKDACDLGYQVTLFFLLGSPYETKADIVDSVKLAMKYPVYDVRFYNLIPFPNTELYEWVTRHNYFLRDSDDYLNEASHWVNEPIFETPELPLIERRKMYKWANRKVKWHTLKVKRQVHHRSVSENFQKLGFPFYISDHLTNLYFSRPFQQLFVGTKFMKRLKCLIPRLRDRWSYQGNW